MRAHGCCECACVLYLIVVNIYERHLVSSPSLVHSNACAAQLDGVDENWAHCGWWLCSSWLSRLRLAHGIGSKLQSMSAFRSSLISLVPVCPKQCAASGRSSRRARSSASVSRRLRSGKGCSVWFSASALRSVRFVCVCCVRPPVPHTRASSARLHCVTLLTKNTSSTPTLMSEYFEVNSWSHYGLNEPARLGLMKSLPVRLGY